MFKACTGHGILYHFFQRPLFHFGSLLYSLGSVIVAKCLSLLPAAIRLFVIWRMVHTDELFSRRTSQGGVKRYSLERLHWPALANHWNWAIT
ncbi:hypothetical protein OOU_Y34scaffold00213g1 [Pyricularia oryzae Y34]|uniref:Uncharacterized protein n=1 Tax=Pyricularia oryzae (strain Y34) TaxID=1143189 RepID=A0AA97P5F2_PYRO3|nr:hypothetical protein OOU_Y34scaffold00213g1 [Pyricularia oryzae Y34]